MAVAVVVALVVVLGLAGALFVFVAASSGHLKLRAPKVQRVVAETNRHLSGKGEVPKFLERLDERRQA